VEHHDAAHALQPDEGKGLLSDTAQSDAFRLGPLGVAAAVKAIGFVMTRVEVLQAGNAAVLTEQTLVIGLTGEELLEEIPGIPHQLAALIPDREDRKSTRLNSS